MKLDIPTTRDANDPEALYFRLLYHEFWFGPFSNIVEVANALKKLDAHDPFWDYDGFGIHYGVVNMKDAVRDPIYVTSEVRDKIETLRQQK